MLKKLFVMPSSGNLPVVSAQSLRGTLERTHVPIARMSLRLRPLGMSTRSSGLRTAEKLAGSSSGKDRERFENRLDKKDLATKMYVRSSVDLNTL